MAKRHLYLCTPDRDDLLEFVEACIAGGVDVVQLREKMRAQSASSSAADCWPRCAPASTCRS